jgi:hypothetical protein
VKNCSGQKQERTRGVNYLSVVGKYGLSLIVIQDAGCERMIERADKNKNRVLICPLDRSKSNVTCP